MTDPSLFGIGKAQWELFNSFANWFAALGSIAAAATALYIATRSARPRARVSVGHRILVGPGSKKPYPEFVEFRIVNTGDRPIRVSQIGWRTGLLPKRFAIQTYEPTQSSPLPVELSHGQAASWMVPLSGQEEPWIDYFAKGMLFPHHQVSLWTLRAQFVSSVGYIFEAKPEKSLMKPLREACERLRRRES
jgi:hypothetical protein